MKVTFLGTGTSQGVPVIGCKCPVCLSHNSKDKRLRTSVHVEVDGISIVIDTGPDFRQQMLREKIDHLDAVIFTHTHKDHTAGLDDIRSYNFLQKSAIDLYATIEAQKSLAKEYEYIFNEAYSYPGIPEVNTITIKNEPFFVTGVEIIPIEVKHYKMPVLGFRINNFVYITDANYISEVEKEKLKNADILVLNALRKEKHISHFNLQEALELIEEVKPKKAYLTHISHLLGKQEDVSKELPESVKLAFDGLSIEC